MGAAARAADDPYSQDFVCGSVGTAVGAVPRVTSEWRAVDRWRALVMRLGLVRRGSTVLPGLYAVGSPDATSPVLVTADSKLSFDLLRRAARAFDAWILVLETSSRDVGSDELVRRIDLVKLSRVVVHRRLVVSRLGAPGAVAPEGGECSGFEVVQGPVKDGDLEAFFSRGG